MKAKVKNLLDNYALEIIERLEHNEFDTHDVVFEIKQRRELQEEYIKLSNEYGSYNKLNAQIGRYLGNHQEELGICKNGGKKVSTTNTGRQSKNQKWKKIILFVPILLLFLSNFSYAQTLFPKQNSKYKWGYVNETGKVAIKYKYDEAKEFSEDLAAVKREGKWGYIDKKGKVIIPLEYDGVDNFSEGLARVKKNYQYQYKWGIIDKTGAEITPIKYNEIEIFQEGLAKVKEGNKLGFIDKTGKEIISVKYDEIGKFSAEGLAKVKIDSKLGFIDKTGKEVVPVKYYEIGEFSAEGMAKVKDDQYHWGFIDKTGKIVIPTKYNEIGIFQEGLTRTKKGEKWGFIDTTGKEVIPFEYNDVHSFSDGYAAVQMSNQFNSWGVIDKAGEEVLPGEYIENPLLYILSSGSLQKEVQRKQEEVQRKQEKLDEERKWKQNLITKYGENFGMDIYNGEFVTGMTKEMVDEIMGEEIFTKTTSSIGNRTTESWMFPQDDNLLVKIAEIRRRGEGMCNKFGNDSDECRLAAQRMIHLAKTMQKYAERIQQFGGPKIPTILTFTNGKLSGIYR